MHDTRKLTRTLTHTLHYMYAARYRDSELDSGRFAIGYTRQDSGRHGNSELDSGRFAIGYTQQDRRSVTRLSERKRKKKEFWT